MINSSPIHRVGERNLLPIYADESHEPHAGRPGILEPGSETERWTGRRLHLARDGVVLARRFGTFDPLNGSDRRHPEPEERDRNRRERVEQIEEGEPAVAQRWDAKSGGHTV